jgi:hypothetical protein
LFASAAALSQAAKQSYPSHLSYSFSNFPWWTDDELRALLKKRIPGLGDEVATTTAAEGRIRDALTALMKEKGIAAEVQSEEPSPSSLQPPPADLFAGMDPDEIQPFHKPSVVFLLFRPKVRVGTVTVEAGAPDAQQAVEREVRSSGNFLINEHNQGIPRSDMQQNLKRMGYFDSKVAFRHSAPYREDDHFLVDVTVIVDPGPRYHVASITGDGGPLFEARDLSSYFTVHPGDAAIPFPFGDLGMQLSFAYQQQGYADVEVRANPTIDREHATVSYALQVIPGPVYHLRSLTINKLSPEQEQRVRELLPMKPGDLYRDRAIDDLYRALRTEPLTKGWTFSFTPKRVKAAAMVDLTLDFSKEGGQATVTVQ